MSGYDELVDRAIKAGLVLPMCRTCLGTGRLVYVQTYPSEPHRRCPLVRCDDGTDRSRAAVLLALVEAGVAIDPCSGADGRRTAYKAFTRLGLSHIGTDPVIAALRAFVAARGSE